MRSKSILFIATAAVLLLCSCQTSPQKAAVIGKGDNKLQKTIAASPAPGSQHFDAKRWEESFSAPQLRCEIKADITVPETGEFPVFKVTKRTFDAVLINRIIRHAAPEATGVRKTQPTKEELTQKLIEAKQGEYNPDSQKWEPFPGQDEQIAQIEEQIKNAPSEVYGPIPDGPAPLPIDNTYKMPDGTRVYITATASIAYIHNYDTGMVQLLSWITDGGYDGEPPVKDLKNVKISAEEAQKGAEAFLKELGIQNMGLAYREKARIINIYTTKNISEGWSLTFRRNDGGSTPEDLESVPASGGLSLKTDEYAERWEMETIAIFIDEYGVREFDWSFPLAVTEVMNKNVPLMPFDQMKEVIRNAVKYGFSNADKGWLNGNDYYMTIDKIVLSNVLAPIMDDPQHQMMIPAWFVYYTDVIGAKSVIAINAIDGSSIDLFMRSSNQ